MGRELDGYRDLLERMDERFPGKEILRGPEICEFTGWSRTTVARLIGRTTYGLPKSLVARKILTVTKG